MKRYRIRPRRQVLASLILAAAFTLSTHATTLHFLSAEDLVVQARDVVHGRVVTADAAWNSDHTAILTTVTLEPLEWFKRTAGDSGVSFTVLGGEVDGKLMTYHHRPVFEPGEEVLVFLARDDGGNRTLMALAQGKWRALPQRGIDGEAAFVRQTRGIEFRKKPGSRIEGFDPSAARSVWGARELRTLAAASARVKPVKR